MKVDVLVPSPGESITEVEIASWVKQDGDYVKTDDILCEIETEKATMPLPAEHSGKLIIKVQEGQAAQVGDVIAQIDTDAQAPQQGKAASEESKQSPGKQEGSSGQAEPAQDKPDHYAKGTPSPAAQKILNEKGLSPDQVKGTGKDGRITKQDAASTQASERQQKSADPKASEAPKQGQQQSGAASDPSPASFSREKRREKMSTLRLKIAERLVAVKKETAMLTTFNEVDMSELKKVRGLYKDSFAQKYGVKLGFMSFFAKAVCQALKEFPAVNGQIEGKEIVYHDYVDLGIAVSAPRGLMVPVVRNAESLSIAQIEQAIAELANKARNSKLTIEEMTGGTFTITNGGVFGSLMSTPIINPPQSAILGMHNIVERPMAVNGQVEIRPMMYVALSYDHRLIDGRESVSTLVRIKQLLEDPARMLLEI